MVSRTIGSLAEPVVMMAAEPPFSVPALQAPSVYMTVSTLNLSIVWIATSVRLFVECVFCWTEIPQGVLLGKLEKLRLLGDGRDVLTFH